MLKNWQILPPASQEFFNNHQDFSPLLLQLLYNRGLKKTKDIKMIMEENDFYDPFLFKNMAASVALIISHLKAGNKIVVYGDYDADGVTSSVILLETLKILHGQGSVYLPDRTSEGYGLNKPAINRLAQEGFKLIITVDNGIRNKEEVIYAQSLGLDLIITDHHVLPEKKEDLPPCLYINPADPEDNYPWKYLAGVGVAFKLITALLAKSQLSASQKELISNQALDLVAIGTVADMVNILGENRQLVKRGLESLNRTKRLGLKELIKVAKINRAHPLKAWNIGWQIGPRLNAASRLAHANSAFALLTTTNPEEARKLATELNERNIERQKITADIVAEVEKQIDPDNLPLVIIGVAQEGQIWNEGVIGLVAGKIAQKYYRPTLIISRLEGEAEFDAKSKKLIPKKIIFKSSGRSVPEFNLVKAIEASSKYLDKYGGHPMACGFSLIGEENLEAFKKSILALASQQLDSQKLIPKLKIDAELKLSDINQDLVDEINLLAPFGQYNPQASFFSHSLNLDDIITMGLNNQHIKFRLSSTEKNIKATNSFWAIAFGAAEKYQEFKIGDKIDLVYFLEINEYNGRRDVQLKIIDIKKSTKQD